MGLVQGQSQEASGECWKLEGPVLVSPKGGYPSDWPTSLNVPAMTVVVYEACKSSPRSSLPPPGMHPEDPDWVVANAEALLPGSPTEWDEEPDHNPLDIIPSPNPTRIGVPIPTSPGTDGQSLFRIYVIPSDDVNEAEAGCQTVSTEKAIERIETYFWLDEEEMEWYCFENAWHNNSPEPNFKDLQNWWATAGFQSPGNYAMGWVHERDQNGIAQFCGDVAIGGETRRNGVDWPHQQITMHELSHLWCADDDPPDTHAYTTCASGDGVMNYCEAYWAADTWDRSAARAICQYFRSCAVP